MRTRPTTWAGSSINCDRLREDLGATVLAVHHTPKGGDTPRGHTSLKNGAEIRLLARKVADALFALEVEHLKDGASRRRAVLQPALEPWSARMMTASR